MQTLLTRCLLLAGAVAFVAAACGTQLTLPPGHDDVGFGGHGGSSGKGGEDITVVTVGPGGAGPGSSSTGGAGGCGLGCSGDLRKVIDTCTGDVKMTCTGDTACLGTGCSPDACKAADEAQTSVGCSYWAVEPDITSDIVGGCFAVFVANTWSTPVHIDVERDGMKFSNSDFIRLPTGSGQALTYEPYDAALGLPPGKVAVVFLSHIKPPPAKVPACPVDAAVNGNTVVFGTGRGKAFHIGTDRPVVAYSILPFGGGSAAATSASLLLPASAWGTNYVAVNPYPKSTIVGEAVPSLSVLANADGTEVTFLPKANVQGGGGVPGGIANQPMKWLLDRGQYVQLSQATELSGSILAATKPVAVWGAASCLNVPVSTPACDSAHQQLPPVRALGRRYAGVRPRNRKAAMGDESPPWRLVGAVDGTQLSWEPAAPMGAPLTLDQGQVAEFSAPGPFVVTSQDDKHPFYAAQYMTGGGPLGGEGDPEWVNIVPVDQFLDYYVFFTDPTYSETSLVVVRAKSKKTKAFVDVTLDCAGPLTGWQPLGDVEYTRLDLVTGDFANVGNCSNGVQTIKSDAPFGVTVWGWGGYSKFFTKFVSYAYPAGAGLQKINEVVIEPDKPK
jgi:hypothetical protein